MAHARGTVLNGWQRYLVYSDTEITARGIWAMFVEMEQIDCQHYVVITSWHQSKGEE